MPEARKPEAALSLAFVCCLSGRAEDVGCGEPGVRGAWGTGSVGRRERGASGAWGAGSVGRRGAPLGPPPACRSRGEMGAERDGPSVSLGVFTCSSTRRRQCLRNGVSGTLCDNTLLWATLISLRGGIGRQGAAGQRRVSQGKEMTALPAGCTYDKTPVRSTDDLAWVTGGDPTSQARSGPSLRW